MITIKLTNITYPKVKDQSSGTKNGSKSIHFSTPMLSSSNSNKELKPDRIIKETKSYEDTRKPVNPWGAKVKLKVDISNNNGYYENIAETGRKK